MTRSGDWEDDAFCRQHNPEIWFPAEATPPRDTPKANYEYAKALCQHCPVMRDCGEWAIANPKATQFGVWGATDPEEREKIRRRRRGDRARSRQRKEAS